MMDLGNPKTVGPGSSNHAPKGRYMKSKVSRASF